jgi:hypothetical protein
MAARARILDPHSPNGASTSLHGSPKPSDAADAVPLWPASAPVRRLYAVTVR